MDGRRDQSGQWRSSIPGVSQRDGAPASLGLMSWGTAAGDGTDGARAHVGLHGVGRRRGGRAWQVLVLAGLALMAVLGVARVAGADAGRPQAAGSGWELAGESGPVDVGGTGAVRGHGVPEEPGRAGPEPAGAPSATAATGALGDPESGDVLSADPPDWWAVLAELDRRRVLALAALDSELLAEYAQPGSAMWSADAALVADLRGRGVRPKGLTSPVVAVERFESQGGQARVQMVDRRSAYALVDDRGSVVESVPEAALSRWSVTLVRDAQGAAGWRVVEVTPSAGGGGRGVGSLVGDAAP